MTEHDRSEIGQLYESEAPRLRRTILGIVRDAALAEDLVQETFCRAMVAWGRFDHAHPGGWLRRIAVNLALDQLRRRRSEQVAVSRLCRPADGAADGGLDQVEDHDQLLDLLRPLDAGQRALLAAHVAGQRTRAELAVELGVPEGTVASRVGKAMTTVRRRVEVGA